MSAGALIAAAELASREATGGRDAEYMIRWLANYADLLARGVSPGYLRADPVHEPRPPKAQKPWVE